MKFIIKNLMETVVETKLNELIKDIDCCKCEKCRMDITAYVLNRLPAKYVSTEKGALLAEVDMLDYQNEANVMINILKAIELIAKNPKHWTADEAKENSLKKGRIEFSFDADDEDDSSDTSDTDKKTSEEADKEETYSSSDFDVFVKE